MLKQNTITMNAFKELFKKQATLQEASKTVSPPQAKAKTITPVPTVPLISLLISISHHVWRGNLCRISPRHLHGEQY